MQYIISMLFLGNHSRLLRRKLHIYMSWRLDCGTYTFKMKISLLFLVSVLIIGISAFNQHDFTQASDGNRGHDTSQLVDISNYTLGSEKQKEIYDENEDVASLEEDRFRMKRSRMAGDSRRQRRRRRHKHKRNTGRRFVRLSVRRVRRHVA